MSIIFSHPTGNANSRAAVNGFAKAGILDEFHTTIASFPGNWTDKIAIGPLKDLKRRSYDPIVSPFTTTHPWFEIGRMVAVKGGFKGLTTHESGVFSIDAVYRHLDNTVAKQLSPSYRRGSKAIYAYEDGAIASFRRAKQLGFKCFYDLPIGYWRSSKRLLGKEREKWPEWSMTLAGLTDSEVKLAKKDEELRLADQIFVASSFTAFSLKEFSGVLPPVKIIPYGFPTVADKRIYTSLANGRRLKILFVGGLSQRKGIADLFDAVKGLEQFVELTIVGSKPHINCPALNTALSKCNWIPGLPHDRILQLMQQQDIFVFPSLFEGFGLVISEAMSQGTPVITTDRTAGPDLIKHGENGWLVEAGNSNHIRQSIENLLSHPHAIAEAGKAAMETARRRPWEVYGEELTKAIIEII